LYFDFFRFEKVFLASPHHLFVELLQQVAFDSSVLLDWLTSNETQFLFYLLNYLKYLGRNFNSFCSLCNSAYDVAVQNAVLTTLQNLKSTIEKLRSKDLFPYPVTPLLKVISTVENLGSRRQDEDERTAAPN